MAGDLLCQGGGGAVATPRGPKTYPKTDTPHRGHSAARRSPRTARLAAHPQRSLPRAVTQDPAAVMQIPIRSLIAG